MKTLFSNPFLKKHRKKALILYLCWWVVKGLVLLLIGFRFTS